MTLWDNIFSINDDRNFGFYKENNCIKFLIPKQLYPPNNSSYVFLRKYNLLLHKYSKSKSNDLSLDSEMQLNKESNLDVINSYFNILDDYFLNDTFKLFEHYYKNGDKKINWNQTLKENNVIISKNNIVYNNFITSSKDINSYNQYYLLYKEALKQAKFLFLGLMDDDIVYSKNKTEQRYHLYKYIEEHFKDRELFIAKNLINIYLNDSWNNINEKKFEFKYYVKFENIWEHMISHITQSYSENISINKTKYLVSDCKGSNLIHDHFLKYNDKYYLLDSKFYDSYNQAKLPSTKDISKQFMYRYLISKQYNININSIINFFIFPKNNPHNKHPEVFDIHYSNDFPELTIYCIAVDINTVIDCYLKNIDYESLLISLEEIGQKNETILATQLKINKYLNENIKIHIHTTNKHSISAALLVSWTDEKNSNSPLIIWENSKGFWASTNNSILEKQKKLLSNGIIKQDTKNKQSFIFTTKYMFNDHIEMNEFFNGDTSNHTWRVDTLSAKIREKKRVNNKN